MITYVYNKKFSYVIKVYENIPKTDITKNEKIISELEYHTILLQNPNIPIIKFNCNHLFE